MEEADTLVYEVLLISSTGTNITGTFLLNEFETGCAVRLQYLETEIVASEDDYFEALCVIRQKLE